MRLTTSRSVIYRENVIAAYGPSWRDFRVSARMRPVLGTSFNRALPLEIKLAVEDIGNQITVFVDGQKVLSAGDDTFREGDAGFIASAPARATFGNFVVEQK